MLKNHFVVIEHQKQIYPHMLFIELKVVNHISIFSVCHYIHLRRNKKLWKSFLCYYCIQKTYRFDTSNGLCIKPAVDE